jgi:excinuclease ABC subunit B
VLYADQITDAMKEMIRVTSERRERQEAHNTEYGITPKSVVRDFNEGMAVYREGKRVEASVVAESEEKYDVHQAISQIEREMLNAADALEFERAAVLRDEIKELRNMLSV